MSSSSRIDPRLRQRRIAVRRAQGRRRLRVVLAVMIVGTLAYGGWRVSQSEILDLDRIVVDGAFGTEADEVRSSSGLVLTEPMISTDLDQAASNVSDLPWVAEATATREWRGTVRIDVVRRIPYAALPSAGGGFVVIDQSGIAISRLVDTGAGELPIIDVSANGQLGDVQEASLPGLAVVAAMPADVDPWVDRIVVGRASSGAVSLGLVLIGGPSVEFGDSRLLTDKFEALRSVLAGTVLSCISTIDVRVADLATVLPDDDCVAALGDGEAP